MQTEELQQRIEQRLYEKKRKRWFNHWWGKLLIVFGFFFGVILVVFVFFVSFYYQKISSGEILSLAVDSIEQEARLDLLHNGDDPSIGPETAPVTIVAFEDFECPFCLEAQPFLKRIVTQYSGDVRLIFKDFPLTVIHENAMTAAEAAQCAYEQGKFWEFHDILFANQERLSEAYYRTAAREAGLNITQYNECYSAGKYRRQINEDLELGRTLGVQGTPTFFINGEIIQGYGPLIEDYVVESIEFIKTL